MCAYRPDFIMNFTASDESDHSEGEGSCRDDSEIPAIQLGELLESNAPSCQPGTFGRGLCGNGCGRKLCEDADGSVQGTCCKSCLYLVNNHGRFGHDCACDVRDNYGMCVPWYWRTKEGTSRHHTEIFHDEIDGAYVQKMGTKLVQHTMPDMEGVGLCLRVQDSALWKTYATRRAEIRTDRPERLHSEFQPTTSALLEYSATTTIDDTVNEVWLFHGTSEKAAKAIAKHDFKLPDHEGHFGKGLYFADNACKAHVYAQANSDGLYVMMLCRVILGRVHGVSGKDHNAARHVAGNANHSVSGVADGRNREFVVYESSQVYPEYIMYYKKDETEEEKLAKAKRKKNYLAMELEVLYKRSWKLSGHEVQNAKKGEELKLDEITFPSHPGNAFSLRFYPKGNEKAKRGFCSIYVRASVPVTMRLRLWINDKGKLLDRTGPKTWKKHGHSNGWSEFGKSISDTATLTIELLRDPDLEAAEDATAPKEILSRPRSSSKMRDHPPTQDRTSMRSKIEEDAHRKAANEARLSAGQIVHSHPEDCFIRQPSDVGKSRCCVVS